ncbi:major capsid family protein [Escherichia coli]|uniref:major capsid family protein n=1 Tax=Escherichia coli TaxID=562 RepID=UPI0010689C49|nr:major capsid family protein [Escherichia coli]TEV35016.1 DUF2184 domain-containing protein [Escherichia coli]
MITFDQATVDSSGAFLIGELERLDQTLNLPLVGYTWTRDIQLREDVSIADDISSWTNTSFAAAGTGANPNGKNWVGKDSTAIAGVNVDIGKSGNPLNLWGMELGWTVIELQAAQQVGRPIDTQKYDGMQLKWQMDNDEQVYVGDSALNLKGLVTLNGVPVNNAAKTWATSTPDEIRASINQALSDAWAASGYSVVPRDLLIPPEQFALLSSIIVSSAGTRKIKIVAPGGLDVVAPLADFSEKVTIHGLLTWMGGMVGSVVSGVASKITGAVEFLGSVKANGKPIDDTHTHGGVQRGGSNTDGVN